LHRDAEQAIAGLHRALLVADDDELGLFPELGDEVEEPVEVDVVEGGLDLVHHVERRRPAAEHREQVGQRGQRPLAARQQRQLLDVLARRLGLDLDTAVERVVSELLSSGPEAVRAAKELIRGRPGGVETAQIAARMRTSEEGQERLRAFLERRS